MYQKYKKRRIKNIIVIDGGSTDNTINILKKIKNIKIFKANKKGLAYQRKLGVLNSKTKFTALIDADMRVTKNSFKIMYKDLIKRSYAGVTAFVKSNKIDNYFDKSYQQIQNININRSGPRRMIGTPTLWHTKILKKIILILLQDPQMIQIYVIGFIKRIYFWYK